MTKSLREEFPNAVPLGGGETFLKWEEPGQRLDGRFLRLREGNQGGFIADVDVKQEDGTMAVVSCSAPKMLADALTGIKQGVRVVIQYDGEQTPRKGGNPYKVFQVVAPS